MFGLQWFVLYVSLGGYAYDPDHPRLAGHYFERLMKEKEFRDSHSLFYLGQKPEEFRNVIIRIRKAKPDKAMLLDLSNCMLRCMPVP